MAKYKYGAEIIGSCPTYLFKRHFFKRTGKDTFNVADGIYELSRKSDHGKEYYRVTGDDCIAITQDEAKTAEFKRVALHCDREGYKRSNGFHYPA